jgi:hypothetical protein
MAGKLLVNRINWLRPLPLGGPYTPFYTWEIDPIATEGPTLNSEIVISHHNCATGKDPTEPAIFKVPPIKILPKVRTE